MELDTSTALEQEITRKTEEDQKLLEQEKEEELRCQKSLPRRRQLAFCGSGTEAHLYRWKMKNVSRRRSPSSEEEQQELGENKEDASSGDPGERGADPENSPDDRGIQRALPGD